jgi:hypothetical protein
MTTQNPWEGLDVGEICGAVAYENDRPNVTADMDETLMVLMQECWDTEQAKRPAFNDIRRRLEKLLGGASPRLPPPAPGQANLGSASPSSSVESSTAAARLWGEIMEEIGADASAKSHIWDEDFVTAIELHLLDGEDITDEEQRVLKGSLCKSGEGESIFGEFGPWGNVSIRLHFF